MPNGIIIGKNSTLQSVNDQLSTGQNQDRQLLARTNKHGETVLYTRPQATGVFDKVSHFIDRQTGRTDRREQRARDVLIDLVGRLDAKTDTEKAGGLFKSLKEAVTSWSANREMTSRVVSNIALAARGLPERTDQPLPPGPTLGSMGIAKDSEFIRDIAKRLGADPTNTDLWNELGHDLGEDLAQELDARGHTDKALDEFAMSDGVRFMTSLSEALGNALSKFTPLGEVEKDALNSIVQSAFLGAASKVRDDGVLQGDGKKIPGGEFPFIEINKRQYEPTKVLGMGGFGKVIEYVAVDNKEDKIALKVSFDLGQRPMSLPSRARNDYAEAMRAAASETNLHRDAYGDGSKEIVGYKGHFRMPDGNIAIAMEIAPNGNVEDMGKSLKKAVDNKTITQEEANVLRLTLLQDMTKGLSQMHGKGIVHLDFKGQNCLIGKDGTAKISDFGMTKGGKKDDNGRVELKHTDLVHPETNFYLSPEIMSSKMTVWDTDKTNKAQVKTVVDKLVTQLTQLFPKGTKRGLLEAFANNVLQKPITDIRAQGADLKAGLKYDHKVDVWGLGTSAIELFTGERPFFHADSIADVDNFLVAFGKNPNNEPLSDPEKKVMTLQVPPPSGIGPLVDQTVVIDAPKQGSLAVKTGIGQIDDLMTRMLKPRGEDRSNAKDLLQHSAFSMLGVGTDAARNLIVALKSGDPTKISSARQDLADLAFTQAPKQGETSQPMLDAKPELVSTGEVLDAWTDAMPPLPQPPTPGKTGNNDGQL